jgi:acetyl-CoA acyltransferase
VRTPIGKRDGGLRDWHPVDLSSMILGALVERNGLDPGRVDDVIWGCVSQTGEQSMNLARWAALAAGFPEHVPGVTVDRQCGSSQQAAHFAAQGVMAGAYDVVIAGGVESMTRVPMGVAISQGPGVPIGPKAMERYEDALVPQSIAAEKVASKWEMPRERLDALSLDSHRRAAAATDEGHFAGQMVPIDLKGGGLLSSDEGIRRDLSPEALAGLQPGFVPGGVVTAGNSAPIADGAAALLVAGEDTAEAEGWKPLARFAGFSVAGVDPVIMLTGAIPATVQALGEAGLGVADIGLFEVNESFASVVEAWLIETGAAWERVNVNGGAIALGHPLGASGAILMTRLVHEMARRGARYGLQAMGEVGGTANAVILELVG